MLGLYQRTLRVAMRHRLLTVGIAVLTVGLTVWVGAALPKGFIPTDDTGFISVRTEAAQDVSFEEMGRHQMVAAEIIAAHPAVESLMSSIGGGGPGGGAGNSGRFFVRLKPRSERAPASTVVAELRRQLADIPGLRAIPQIPPALNLPGTGGARALYQVTLTADDLDTLYDNAASFERKMRELPALADVTSDLQITSPQLRVDIRRDQAAALGITPAEIEDALYSAFGTRQVSTILTPANQYFVIMELAPEFQRDPAALSLLHVRARNGRLVPLDAVAGVSRDVGPLTVAHFGQLPAVTVSFNLKPGFALGDATDAIKALARAELPATVNYALVGSAQAFDQSMQGMLLLVGLALIVVYIVLGVLYEDFVHPLTILSGVPAAGFGALLTLWLFGEELNIMGYVGVILLIGIVKKNAIMMIDFAVEAERARRGVLARASHRRGLPRAFPAHHDDNLRRPRRRVAHRARPRRGRGVASPARPRRRRRPRRIATSHALHHPRALRDVQPPHHPPRSAGRRGGGGRCATGGEVRNLRSVTPLPPTR
jgi:HAE1 family hydrophobic/amphiphilic exporter-1